VIAPSEQRLIAFSMRPPAGTAPGQYLAGIAAYVANEPSDEAIVTAANQAGAGINLQTRYVIGVQIDVPGEWRPSLAITGASALEQPSGTKLGIDLRNNGDIFLKPTGSVTLTDASGKQLLTQPIRIDTVLPGTEMVYPIAWPGVPAAGTYDVIVELAYADDLVASYRGQIAVSDDAPVAPPRAGDPLAAVAPMTPPPASVPTWMIYTLGLLLLAVVILLALNLLRNSRRAT
jgi:hypothetical protein